MNFSLHKGLAGRRITSVHGVWLRARRDGEHGATAVEYGLMVALIAVVIIVAVSAFGISVSALFSIPAGVFGG